MDSEAQANNQPLYKFCLRCGKRLVGYEAQKIGMGKTCLKKSKLNIVQKGKLFDERI